MIQHAAEAYKAAEEGLKPIGIWTNALPAAILELSILIGSVKSDAVVPALLQLNLKLDVKQEIRKSISDLIGNVPKTSGEQQATKENAKSQNHETCKCIGVFEHEHL